MAKVSPILHKRVQRALRDLGKEGKGRDADNYLRGIAEALNVTRDELRRQVEPPKKETKPTSFSVIRVERPKGEWQAFLWQGQVPKTVLAMLKHQACTHEVFADVEILARSTHQFEHRLRRGRAEPKRFPRWKRGQLHPRLSVRCEELEVSVRADNCLQNMGIVWVGELVQLSDKELMKGRNMGRRSASEIRRVLEDRGLFFGMDVLGWKPPTA